MATFTGYCGQALLPQALRKCSLFTPCELPAPGSRGSAEAQQRTVTHQSEDNYWGREGGGEGVRPVSGQGSLVQSGTGRSHT